MNADGDDNEEKDLEFEADRKKELEKIEAVRTKFAAADLSNIKKNTFDKNPPNRYERNQSRNSNPEKESKRPSETVKPVKKTETVYRALPTVSGLKLDQKLLGSLVEMGFDRGLATQALQEADNDFYMALDGLENLKKNNQASSTERDNRRGGRRGGKGRRGRNNHEEEERAAPASNLFDFIQDDKIMKVSVGQETFKIFIPTDLSVFSRLNQSLVQPDSHFPF